MTLPPSTARHTLVQGQPIEYISPLDSSSLLSRPLFSRNQFQSPLQAQVDSLVGGFAQQATDWRSLAAMMAGGMTYRLGRMGAMATGTGRLASLGIGLGAEVTAFEMTNRSLSSLTGDSRSSHNLWRWDGQGGIRQGLLSSLVTFGTLKGAGRLAQGENVVVQHLVQDTGMVMGHQVSASFGITDRPQGTLVEQFLHAEVTNLQMGAGMSLAHSFAPGIQGLEQGLDLSLRGTDIGAPLQIGPQHALAAAGAGTVRSLNLQTHSRDPGGMTVLQMSSNGSDGNGGGRDSEPVSPQAASVPPLEDGSRSPGSGQFSEAFSDLVHSPGFEEMIRDNFPVSQPPRLLAAQILRPSPNVTYSEVRQDGKNYEIEFRVSSLGAGKYGTVTENTFLSKRGIIPPEMTFVGRHPLIAQVIQETMDNNPGAQVIHGVERMEYRALPYLGREILSRSSVRVREGTVILSHELVNGKKETFGSGRTILAIIPEGTPLPEPPVRDPSSLGELVMTYTVPENLPERYSEVSGDHNPVHKGPNRILHGMATMNLAHAAYRSRQDPKAPIQPFAMEAKFSGAVRPGDTLRFFFESGQKTNSVFVLNERNQLVLTLDVKEQAGIPRPISTIPAIPHPVAHPEGREAGAVSEATTVAISDDAPKPSRSLSETGSPVRWLFVTGGSSGIGQQLVLQAVQRGYEVVYGGSRPPASLSPALQALQSAGYYMVDVRDRSSVDLFRDIALSRFERKPGSMLVVASAGVSARGKDADLEAMREINIEGTRRLLNAFAPALTSSPGNRFVGVGSIVAVEGTAIRGDEAYQETKRQIHEIVASHGGQGFTLVPGAVDTPMTRNEMIFGFLMNNLVTSAVRDDSPFRTGLLTLLNGENRIPLLPADLLLKLLPDSASRNDKLTNLLKKDPQLSSERSQLLLASLLTQDKSFQEAVVSTLGALDLVVPPEVVAQRTLDQFESGVIPEHGMLKVYSRSGENLITHLLKGNGVAPVAEGSSASIPTLALGSPVSIAVSSSETSPDTPAPEASRGAVLDGTESGVLPKGTLGVKEEQIPPVPSTLKASDDSTFQMMNTLLKQVGLVGQSLNFPELMTTALRLSMGSRVEGVTIDYVKAALERASSPASVNVDEIAGRVMDLAKAKETRTIKISRRDILADPVAGAEAVVNGLRQMDPALLSETARFASTSEVSRQTNSLLGSSDGYGFLTFTAALATGAFRHGIANFFVDPRIVRGSPEAPKYASRQFSNIYGLEILNEAMGARLESVNASTILTPFEKPVFNPLSSEYLEAVGRIRAEAPLQAINLINSIAWAPYMGPAPGGVQLKRVPDINENGQVLLTKTKEFDQAAYEGTLRTMGLNHLALLAAHQRFFGPETKTIGYTWVGGSQDIWTMAGSYGRAALGNSKDLMELGALLMHLHSLQNGGSYGAHLIAELPYAKTAASSQIAGAPSLGHFQQKVLLQNNAFRSTPNLALDLIHRLVSGRLNLGNPRTSIVLDSHEKLHSAEISQDHIAFIIRVARYAQEHPEWDGSLLPKDISQKLIEG
jgi:NAD(P)-dependent dehydrogenase (short-subunit alcohol dehydrogenase family)/acyl dehydratase